MDFTYIVLAIALVAAAAIVAFALLRRRQGNEEAPLLATRLDTLTAAEGEATGRLLQAIETLVDRIEKLETRVGTSLTDSANKTAETLGGIQTRLTVIDDAQKNIAALSGQVVSLQEILSDKQARGAWGQDRMEDIVRDQLPPELYDFQKPLSNGKSPDCIIRIPGMALSIVVDAKFPLESFEALKDASDEISRKQAMAQVRNDIQKHIKDISEKYLIEGEVQVPAIMFVPSESIYAELHQLFPDVLQRARRAQVVIVSPHIFWLAVNTIRTLMRDAKMREKAHEIQKEVGILLKDVNLLAERVQDLRTHFERTSKDIGEIEKPMKRIVSRANAIEKVEISTSEEPEPLLPPN